MARKLGRRRTEYTAYERQVLLTGVPVSPMRFGYPRRIGWNVKEIRRAWEQIGDELMHEWESNPRYQHERERYGDPFVMRLLRGDERTVL